jgi:hypothetical protein
LFTDSPSIDKLSELAKLKEKAETHNFIVQTIRLSSHKYDAILQLDAQTKGSIFLNLGTLTVENAHEYLARILAANNIHFNLDLTNEIVTKEHTKIYMK